MQPFLLLLGLAVVGVVVVLVLRHRQSEQRSLAESAFRDLADAMQLGITLSNRRGQIVYSNKADAELHGYEPEELLGKPSNVLGAPTARQTVGLTDMENFGSWKRDTLNARKDGEVFPVHLRSDVVRDQDGGLKGVITTCEDITERKRAEELESHNALEEPLTGLANRTFFLELVNRAVKRSKRHPDYRFAVLYMDIERFRLINDSLGHDAGDALLIGMATVLQESIRPNDVAARIAGDEFALLLDAIGHVTDATRVAGRIVQKLTTPFEYEGREVYLIPNIGIAVSAADRDDPEQYLKEASVAMTRVRDQGTERRFHVSDELIQRRATQRLRLETDLRKAIDQEELRAFYQPIVDLRSGEIAGFEALVRWTHGERGMISPGEFIPAAEETGLVVPIGSWMLREACRQLRDWQDRVEGYPNLNMNVNLSVRHLGQAGLLEEVSQVLEQTGLRADHLKLEVTESMLMENAAQQVDVLGELRELGVGVAIDDFGTGYSSLSYLQQFEIDSLKIDRSFLPQSKEDRDWDIVRMIISLAQNKSATVVAEGVETQEQLDQLRKLGCDRAQGFLFSKPLPSDEAEKLLKG